MLRPEPTIESEGEATSSSPPAKVKVLTRLAAGHGSVWNKCPAPPASACPAVVAAPATETKPKVHIGLAQKRDRLPLGSLVITSC